MTQEWAFARDRAGGNGEEPVGRRDVFPAAAVIPPSVFAPFACILETIALAVGLDDVDPVGQTVEKRHGQPLAAAASHSRRIVGRRSF